jgi:hypothetical protein
MTEAYLVYVAISQTTITEKLQNYTGLKGVLVRRWQLETSYVIGLVLSITAIIQLHERLKLLYPPFSIYSNTGSSNT